MGDTIIYELIKAKFVCFQMVVRIHVEMNNNQQFQEYLKKRYGRTVTVHRIKLYMTGEYLVFALCINYCISPIFYSKNESFSNLFQICSTISFILVLCG